MEFTVDFILMFCEPEGKFYFNEQIQNICSTFATYEKAN